MVPSDAVALDRYYLNFQIHSAMPMETPGTYSTLY